MSIIFHIKQLFRSTFFIIFFNALTIYFSKKIQKKIMLNILPYPQLLSDDKGHKALMSIDVQECP